jgi:hypothetical protein
MLALGKMYFVILSFIFLKSLTGGNWKALIVCNLLPSIVSAIGSLIFLDESPRFLIAKG